MANWITHLILADLVSMHYPDLDERAFCVGNVAPDCNILVEGELVPSRETTHFMDGDDKLSARYDLFFETYIADRPFLDKEERSFLLGYWMHLIADVEYLRFCRDREHLRRVFARIRKDSRISNLVEGKEETFLTLLRAFGKDRVFADIVRMENDYLKKKPDCSYNRILRHIEYFPNYLNIFQDNHFAEKIAMMIRKYDKTADTCGEGLFFTETEYLAYLERVSETVCTLMDTHILQTV